MVRSEGEHRVQRRRSPIRHVGASVEVVTFVCVVLLAHGVTRCWGKGATDGHIGKRPATVADSIRMTRLADPSYYAGGSSRGLVAQFSPDGMRFIVLVRRGNLESNTNEFTLLLFRTANAFHSPHPEELITISSSSNLEAIKQPMWLNDNDTILFLGAHLSDARQLYSLKTSTKKLTQLTHRATSVLAYAASARGDRLVILTEKPPMAVVDDEARRAGIVISNQTLTDIVSGRGDEAQVEDCDLFVGVRGILSASI